MRLEINLKLLNCYIYFWSEYKLNCSLVLVLSLHLGTVRLTEAIILTCARRQGLARVQRPVSFILSFNLRRNYFCLKQTK